jgi:hypothetical protein
MTRTAANSADAAGTTVNAPLIPQRAKSICSDTELITIGKVNAAKPGLNLVRIMNGMQRTTDA